MKTTVVCLVWLARTSIVLVSVEGGDGEVDHPAVLRCWQVVLLLYSYISETRCIPINVVIPPRGSLERRNFRPPGNRQGLQDQPLWKLSKRIRRMYCSVSGELERTTTAVGWNIPIYPSTAVLFFAAPSIKAGISRSFRQDLTEYREMNLGFNDLQWNTHVLTNKNWKPHAKYCAVLFTREWMTYQFL